MKIQKEIQLLYTKGKGQYLICEKKANFILSRSRFLFRIYIFYVSDIQLLFTPGSDLSYNLSRSFSVL